MAVIYRSRLISRFPPVELLHQRFAAERPIPAGRGQNPWMAPVSLLCGSVAFLLIPRPVRPVRPTTLESLVADRRVDAHPPVALRCVEPHLPDGHADVVPQGGWGVDNGHAFVNEPLEGGDDCRAVVPGRAKAGGRPLQPPGNEIVD